MSEDCRGIDPTADQLFRAWRDGDQKALHQLTPLMYEELRRIARRHMRSERADHTLQTTALVHEAFVGLVHANVTVHDRAHFFALAARFMRRILIDYAKSRSREKRGGGLTHLTLDDALVVSDDSMSELLELDIVLDKLASFDSRKGQLVEMHFFGGLTYDEMASAMELSPATVHRELRLAKAWLYREIHAGDTASH